MVDQPHKQSKYDHLECHANSLHCWVCIAQVHLLEIVELDYWSPNIISRDNNKTNNKYISFSNGVS